MISNNKAIDAMANDLKLFLNDNAETFAAWLKNVLDKLKLVTKSAAAKAGTYNVLCKWQTTQIMTSVSNGGRTFADIQKPLRQKSTHQNPGFQKPF